MTQTQDQSPGRQKMSESSILCRLFTEMQTLSGRHVLVLIVISDKGQSGDVETLECKGSRMKKNKSMERVRLLGGSYFTPGSRPELGVSRTGLPP